MVLSKLGSLPLRTLMATACGGFFSVSALGQLNDQEWLDGLLAVEEEEVLTDLLLLSTDGMIYDSLSESSIGYNGWNVDSEYAVGLGWKENVLNSNLRSVDSLYGQAQFDFFAMRPGVGRRPDLLALLFGDYRFYEDVPGLSAETLMVAHGQAAAPLWGNTRGSAIVEAVHSKQAFDASTEDFQTDAIAITLWQPEVKFALERDTHSLGSVKAFGGVSKAFYNEDSENYDSWDYGIGWSHETGDQSQLAAQWSRFVENYDQRRARFSDAEMGNTPLLKLRGNRWNMEWIYRPEEGVLRASRSRVLFQAEHDAVGDYYERDQWELRQSLEWAWGAWSLEATGSIGTIDYAARRAAPGWSETRADETLRLNAEVSRQVSRNLRAFARYERVDKDSNSEIFAYESDMAAFGIRLAQPGLR